MVRASKSEPAARFFLPRVEFVPRDVPPDCRFASSLREARFVYCRGPFGLLFICLLVQTSRSYFTTILVSLSLSRLFSSFLPPSLFSYTLLAVCPMINLENTVLACDFT